MLFIFTYFLKQFFTIIVLNSDYAQCLNYLMKYPSTVDVLDVVNYAVYLKEPTVFMPVIFT